MSKVSIIVPFYNVGPYIGRCLESLKNQTFKDIEILMVDDGSKDNSIDVAQQYASQDKRFRLITRKNGGLSAARNTGLEHVSGEFIVFVDSDDWAEQTFIDKMVGRIIQTKSDFVCCRLQYVDSKGKKTVYGKDFEFGEMKENIAEDAFLVKNIHTPVWAKIYDFKFLKRYNLRFREGVVNEDAHFTSLVTLNAKKVAFVNEVLFNSLEREGSISRSSQERLFRDMATVMEEIRSYMKHENFWVGEMPNAFKERYVKGMLYNLLQSAQRLPYSNYVNMKNICFTETEYKTIKDKSVKLPILHSVFYELSKCSPIFYGTVKFLNLIGYKMH